MTTYPHTDVAANGCTGKRPDGRTCGTQRTVVLSSRDGRRCPEHAVLPDTYRRQLAMDLVDAGRPDTAYTYLRRALARRARSTR